MDAPSVTLGDVSATLEKPGALAALTLSRDEARLNGDGIVIALGAAALVLCWPASVRWPARPRPRSWRPGESLEALGHSAFDALIAAGVPLADTIAACSTAYTYALSALLTEREVAEAVNFSEPLEEGAA